MPEISFSNDAPDQVLWSTTNSLVGPLLIGLTKQRQLCRVTFLEKRKPAADLRDWKKAWPQTQFTENPRTPRLSDETPILLVGSDFQHRVWAALLDIPVGEPVTYGELGAKIGKPTAARAVGTALGANPVPLFVPCHRVVSARSLGGYTGGLEIKRKLLNEESMWAFRKK